MVNQLQNPLTENYISLKKDVLSDFFPWFWIGVTVDYELPDQEVNSFFGHSIVTRPKASALYPVATSNRHVLCNQVLSEIFEANKIEINSVMRINFNLTLKSEVKHCEPHCDHPFPHKNLLIYLNNSDGDTVAEGESISPKEDKIILFEGRHHHYFPSKGRRVVMVVTFI